MSYFNLSKTGVVTSFVFCIIIRPSLSQPTQTPPQPPQGAVQHHLERPKLWGQNQNANTTVQVLKDAPELPQLPAYSGKAKFLQGWYQPTERGWTNYQISYLTKETPLEVKDWYQNAFNSYQWKTIHSGQQSLNANHKDGHICTVIVNKINEPGFRTQLRIYYNMAPARGVRPPSNSNN